MTKNKRIKIILGFLFLLLFITGCDNPRCPQPNCNSSNTSFDHVDVTPQGEESMIYNCNDCSTQFTSAIKKNEEDECFINSISK